MAVGDAGEDRDDFLVAFERVDIDDMTAVRKQFRAGASDEPFDAATMPQIRPTSSPMPTMTPTMILMVFESTPESPDDELGKS